MRRVLIDDHDTVTGLRYDIILMHLRPRHTKRQMRGCRSTVKFLNARGESLRPVLRELRDWGLKDRRKLKEKP